MIVRRQHVRCAHHEEVLPMFPTRYFRFLKKLKISIKPIKISRFFNGISSKELSYNEEFK